MAARIPARIGTFMRPRTRIGLASPCFGSVMTLLPARRSQTANTARIRPLVRSQCGHSDSVQKKSTPLRKPSNSGAIADRCQQAAVLPTMKMKKTEMSALFSLS